MEVDSFKFLPRSFRAMFAPSTPPSTEPVWAPFETRLAESTITLVTSAGLYVEGEQEPFDGERERQEPTWGDPTHRLIPRTTPTGGLGMMHLHVNNEDVLADRNVALPIDVLDELVAEGVVGGSTADHVSVMGYQGPLDVWQDETAPAIIEMLRAQGSNGVVLAPV